MTEDSLLALVAAVRPLEFYMPVRLQRERWTADPDVVVASILDEKDAPIAFDVTGSRIDVAVGKAPTSPTLALVPVETDFSRTLNLPELVNSRLSEDAIGTWTRAPGAELQPSTGEDCDPRTSRTPCDDDLEPGGPAYGIVPAYEPSGLYMTYTSLNDDGEADIRGDPEIEAYIVGPLTIDHRDDIRVIACAAEGNPHPRNFNQDGLGWHGYVLLLSEEEFKSFRYIDTLPDNREFSVILYEDDDAECQIRDDDSRMLNHLGWLAYWGFTGHKLKKYCERPNSSDTTCGLGVWGMVFWARWILWNWPSSDDYLGLAMEKSRAPSIYLPAANYTLLRQDTAVNGGIRLDYHQQQ